MPRRALAVICGLVFIAASSPALAQVASSYATPVVQQAADKSLAGYDKGFFLRSADDAFRLQLYSRLQFQYFYQHIQETGSTDTSTFRLRRARLYVFGKLFDRFEFSNWVSHGTSSSRASSVTDAGGNQIGQVQRANTLFWWADMTANIIPQFNITVGKIGLPMDYYTEVSSGKRAFVEAPITATQKDGLSNKTIARQAFGPGSTLGVKFWGDISKFHYMAGIGNGEDDDYFNVTRQFAYGARVWYDILGEPGYTPTDISYSETPQLAVGAGALYDPQDAPDPNVPGVILDWSLTSSGNAVLKWKGLTVLGEAYFRKVKVLTGDFTLDDFGYLGQIGYFAIPKKFEIVGRAAQIFREGPDNNAYEFAGGLNWYLHGNNVKWQFDYSRVVDFDATEGTGGLPSNRFRTMLQFQI